MRSILCVALMAAAAGAARADFTLLDDFNRPEAGTLGPGWTQRAGAIGIVNDSAVGVVGQVHSLATFDGVSASTVTMDVFATAGLANFAAIVLGYGDLANNLFVKVQNDGAVGAPAAFTSYAFYFGLNGNNNDAWAGSGFFFRGLTSTFQSARMTVSLAGNVVTLSLDTNFDGLADQSYSAGGVPLGLLGNGIGIGTYHTTRIDNYGTGVYAVPEPSSIALAAIGGLGLVGVALRVKRPR